MTVNKFTSLMISMLLTMSLTSKNFISNHQIYSNHNIIYRNSNYVRDWTGYMTIHTALTCEPGTKWTFDKNFKVVQINKS